MSNNSSIAEANDNLENILLFRLIVWGYVGIVLSVFGIVGNIITILVLISPSMRTTSTNIYLTALSCSNILFLLIFIPSYSVRYLVGYRLYVTDQPPFAFEILLTRLPTTPIYNTILLSIIYLTIAVSMDRLILVKFPLKAKLILTQRVTLIAILSIYIFSIVYCIPYWLEQRYVSEKKRCYLTNIGQKIHKYTRIYIYIPVVYLIPVVTLTCINISIIQNLIAKKRRKKSLGTKNSKKKQADYYITLMLVAVIIIFVLCQLPLLILNAWYAIDPTGSYDSFSFHLLNIIGVLLIVFNTSTNFFLYCFFGQKFRQTLIQFILHILPKQSKQSSLQTRVARIADKQTQQQQQQLVKPPEQRQRMSAANATTTTNDLKKSTDLTTTTNEPVVQTASLKHEESSPLISNSEQISIIHSNVPFKIDPNLNLYTSASGKRILVLKI